MENSKMRNIKEVFTETGDVGIMFDAGWVIVTAYRDRIPVSVVHLSQNAFDELIAAYTAHKEKDNE